MNLEYSGKGMDTFTMSIYQNIWMSYNPEYKSDENMKIKLRGSVKVYAVSLNVLYVNIHFLLCYIIEVEMVFGLLTSRKKELLSYFFTSAHTGSWYEARVNEPIIYHSTFPVALNRKKHVVVLLGFCFVLFFVLYMFFFLL